MTNKQKPPRARNPLHNHPLMSKGGAHEKPNKAKRKAEKQKLKRELRQKWGYSIRLATV